MEIENVKKSECSSQAHGLAQILQIFVVWLVPGEAGHAWGKGEVSPLVAAPGLFFLVSGNSAAAQTCIFHLSETNPSTRQSCSL